MKMAHQPGSEPISIPEQIPNPAVRPAPPTRPEREPDRKPPVKVPKKEPANHRLALQRPANFRRPCSWRASSIGVNGRLRPELDIPRLVFPFQSRYYGLPE